MRTGKLSGNLLGGWIWLEPVSLDRHNQFLATTRISLNIGCLALSLYLSVVHERCVRGRF